MYRWDSKSQPSIFCYGNNVNASEFGIRLCRYEYEETPGVCRPMEAIAEIFISGGFKAGDADERDGEGAGEARTVISTGWNVGSMASIGS
jgi:hypothetical protein